MKVSEGKCKRCGKVVSLTKMGVLWHHKANFQWQPYAEIPFCPGSGKAPGVQKPTIAGTGKMADNGRSAR